MMVPPALPFLTRSLYVLLKRSGVEAAGAPEAEAPEAAPAEAEQPDLAPVAPRPGVAGVGGESMGTERPAFTLGVEEEFQIIDPDTRELRSHVQEILEEGKLLLKERVKPEMHQSVIEIGTGICKNVDEVREAERFGVAAPSESLSSGVLQ